MKRLRSLLLPWVFAALGGCALFVPKLAPPGLAIVNVRVRRADFWEQRLDVRVRVRNPNSVSLPVHNVQYTLDIEGRRFATGTCAQGFTVPAHGTADFDTEVTANMTGALLTVLARGRGQPIQYRLIGKVELSHGWLRSLPFDERGAFTLQ